VNGLGLLTEPRPGIVSEHLVVLLADARPDALVR
jgi:hypothetical protein